MADLDRLRLTQILSPAFPIGSFAHSQGLEWAIDQGWVATPARLQDWIETLLTQGPARCDAIFLTLARAPDADLARLAALYDAWLPSAERAIEAAELGRGFQAMTDPAAPALPYVLALGRETAAMDLDPVEVLALYLQSLVAQLVSVAIRFMPMGQAQGQAILTRLAPLILDTARQAATASEDDLSSFTPGADLAAMAHETMETRIFRT